MGGKGGGGSVGGGTTTVQMPAEQSAIYQQLLPMITMASQRATSGQPLYQPPSGYPSAPGMSSMMSYLRDMTGGYNVPSTSNLVPSTANLVPSVSGLLPTKDWWSNLEPGVKSGIMQPFETGADTLAEQMNRYGQLGSARGGASGSAGASLGNYWAQAMPKAALTGWSMTEPGLEKAWQAQLGANQLGWQAQLGANQLGWQSELAKNQALWNLNNQIRTTDYQSEQQRRQQDYAAQQQQYGLLNQAYAAPWSAVTGPSQIAGNLPQVGSYSPSGYSQAMGAMGSLGSLGLGAYGLNSLIPGGFAGMFGGGTAAASAIPWLAGAGGAGTFGTLGAGSLAAGVADTGAWLLPALALL